MMPSKVGNKADGSGRKRRGQQKHRRRGVADVWMLKVHVFKTWSPGGCCWGFCGLLESSWRDMWDRFVCFQGWPHGLLRQAVLLWWGGGGGGWVGGVGGWGMTNTEPLGLALEPPAPFLIVLMFSFNYHSMRVHACTNVNMPWHVCRGRRPTSWVSSFLVDFEAPTQVVWRGDKRLFLLQYLTSSRTLSLCKLVASGVCSL